MNQLFTRTHRTLVLWAALASLLLFTTQTPAEPVRGQQDQMVVRLVCDYLHRAHLNRPEINEQLSKQLFHRFLKDLDPTKGYFLKSDVEEFQKHETELAAELLKGDLSFAYDVYHRFVERVGQRLKLIEELVNTPQDYTVKESLNTDFDHKDYPQSDTELRERWRKRIKFDLLTYRLGTKPIPDDEARKKVYARYKSVLKRWKDVDNFDLMELYLSSLTNCLDPHSSYMSPATLDDFDIAMRLNLEGIGASLRSENGQTIVVEVIPGGAAAVDSRLKANDKIIGVAQGDGKFVDVVDMKLRDVVKLIRGRRGTPVELRVLPNGKVEPVVIALTRQKVELKDQEARGEIIEGKKADGKPYRIGVIDLPSFYADMSAARGGRGNGKSATEDVRRILNNFNAKGVDGVVLDLRRNGGGALSEALALTGLFIDQGPIVQVKGFQGKVQRYDDPEKGTVYNGPVMVLVSRLSASASEILAGALQDYGRALIVGDSGTHGKGTVQMVIDLGDRVRADPPLKLGALKLTIQQFYRVNGDSTQNRGVTPDLVLPSFTEYLSTAEKDLDNALAFSHVNPVDHQELQMVPAELKGILKARSAERVKNSSEFAKLIKQVEQLKTRRDRKSIPLNEQELREQFKQEEAEKADQKQNGILPPETPATDTVYKFPRTFENNEILHIMEDLMQGKQLLTAK